MNTYEATEQAYKNGYEQGKKDALKWIPVSERLPHFFPERQRKVIVTIEDENGKRFTSYARYNEEFKRWCGFTHSRFFDEDNHFKVVAWMEKPEPWKGE